MVRGMFKMFTAWAHATQPGHDERSVADKNNFCVIFSALNDVQHDTRHFFHPLDKLTRRS
jgi:hypothetical protein